MKLFCWLGVLVALAALVPGLAGGQGKTTEGDKFDAAKLAGTWKFVSGVKNGEKLGADHFKDQTITIDKDKLTLKTPDATFVMKFELDTKKSPVGIKLEITEGPVGVGSKSPGIIELKGDDLKICYAPMDSEAPKTFEAKEGSKLHLFTLKRSK